MVVLRISKQSHRSSNRLSGDITMVNQITVIVTFSLRCLKGHSRRVHIISINVPRGKVPLKSNFLHSGHRTSFPLSTMTFCIFRYSALNAAEKSSSEAASSRSPAIVFFDARLCFRTSSVSFLASSATASFFGLLVLAACSL